MATAALSQVKASNVGTRRVPRTLGRDSRLVALAVLHAAVLLLWPSVVTIALGLWWNANTISHNFIHRPFFRSRRANFLFSCYLSALLGFPQTLWRDRHLSHHAGAPLRLRFSMRLATEIVLVAAVWAAIFLWNPRFFALGYLPGYLAGLLLCAAQGHYEHARGVTSHYGRLYNLLCFNDGFHAEHHAYPGVHWSELPSRIRPDARASRWPPILRWLDSLNLEGLERLVLRSRRLQAMVLRSHRRAFRELLRGQSPPAHVTIVGGGLFPRTALALRELLPGARITILDASRHSLAIATPLLPSETEVICRRYFPGESLDCDLAVIPLAFDGDRERIYRDPPARVTLVHDWIWRQRGAGSIVSIFLLKRLNLVTK
jgi:hypothetical protein